MTVWLTLGSSVSGGILCCTGVVREEGSWKRMECGGGGEQQRKSTAALLLLAVRRSKMRSPCLSRQGSYSYGEYIAFTCLSFLIRGAFTAEKAVSGKNRHLKHNLHGFFDRGTECATTAEVTALNSLTPVSSVFNFH